MRDQFEIDQEEPVNTTSGSTFVLGIVCGAALGAAVGLLFAPKAGVATRRDLKKSAERLSRRAMKMYDNANTVADRLAERGADALDRASEMAETVSSRVRT